MARSTMLPLNIYGLNDAVTTGWSENTIDWNNAPGKTANSIDPAATTLLFSGSVSYTSNGQIGFSGSAFTDFLGSDTDGSFTFILTQGDANKVPTMPSAARSRRATRRTAIREIMHRS